MAQAIKNLATGSKIKDTKGNIFTVVAHNRYGSNQVTLFHESSTTKKSMISTSYAVVRYDNTNVHNYLNSATYLNTLQSELKNVILNTEITYVDVLSSSSFEYKTVTAKAFIPSLNEMITKASSWFPNDKYSRIPYFEGSGYTVSGTTPMWTRTEEAYSFNGTTSYVYWVYTSPSQVDYYDPEQSYLVKPLLNIESSVLVSDEVTNGYYSFAFNQPPTIENIGNIKGNYGTPTSISYIARDNDDTNLTHYISFNNGATYSKINPSLSGNTYTYSHIFNSLGTYYCRIKVVDSVNNEATSNTFTITVSATAPSVNIVSVIDKLITFKANCTTSEISKVEIFINNSVVKTYENGFLYNLTYQVDGAILNTGKNSIQIKAISSDGLEGYANLEASKEKYPIPPAGTKLKINDIEYDVLKVVENGIYHTYTLASNLIKPVSAGDIIKVSQDNLKVLCSLSNLDDVKDYQEMKLVKVKKLKGYLEGYIEEKYELQGTGRYSTIKLELERYSNAASTEVLELQQYFDYMED